MRVLRVLFCLLVLAAAAAAQSSSTSATGAQAQNPLSTQPSAAQQQQAGEQRGRPTSFDVGGAATAEEDQELGEVRMMTRYTQIGGSAEGRARSFRNPGSNNLGEFNYFIDHRFAASRHRWQFLSMFRGTDDNSIDPERNSLQKGYLRVYGPRDEYIFGDALVNYSRLSFNQNIKGMSDSWKIGNAVKLSVVSGVFIDRYGSLFKDMPLRQGQFLQNGVMVDGVIGCAPPPGYTGNFQTVNNPQCGRPFTAAVNGARLEYAFARDSALGFNFSSSDDLIDTRREQPFNTSPMPATNRLGSIDLKLQAGMLRLDGEGAYSATNFETRPGACVAPCDSRVPTPGLGVQGDWGGRMDASWRHKKLSLRGSYVRFQPVFASMNARQIADLQDMLFRISYDATDFLTIDGTLRRSNDDLKDQLPYQKVMWGPEGRLIFHDLPFYRRATFELGYRHRIIDGFNATVPTGGVLAGCVAGTSGGMVCVDRFVRTPFAEFTLPVKTTFLTLGYERRQSVDRLKAGGTSNTDRVYAGFRGIYDAGAWHINPSARYEMERQGSRPGLDNVAPGGVLSPIDLFLLRETNRLATVSLYIETPRWFIVEAAFRDNSSTTLSGYSRPSYRANLTYKIANDENKLFILSFERNNNFYYSTQGCSSVPVTNCYAPGGILNPINFDERMMGVTFVYKFGKRAR